MVNLVSRLWNWLWPPKEEILSVSDAYNILDQDDEVTEIVQPETATEEPIERYTCCLKTGKITKADETCFEIDNHYTFQSELDLKEGSNVSFIVRKENNEIKVSNIYLIDNEWELGNIVDTENKWCYRTLVTKVVERSERNVICDPGNCTVDLNKVASEFVPIVGDWLQLDVKCVLNQEVSDLFGSIIEISKIHPLRSSAIMGKITQFYTDTQTGVVNKNIFFSTDILPLGYFPSLGDGVTCEVIESDQEGCTWRALKLVVDSKMRKSLPENEIEDTIEEDADNSAIKIPRDLVVTFESFREKKNFSIDIANTSNEMITFKKFECRMVNASVKLVYPSFITNYNIQAHRNLTMSLQCRPNSVGVTKELLVFHIDKFTIKRLLTVKLVVAQKHQKQRYRKKVEPVFDSSNTSYRIFHAPKSGQGVKFVGRKTGEFPLPKNIYHLFLNAPTTYQNIQLLSKLEEIKPVLIAKLCYEIYEEYFHSLLFIEESYLRVSLKQYDQKRAMFIKNKDFLMLEIENLAEKRPSVTTGDIMFVKKPYEKSKVFEGFICKVSNKHIWVKFIPMFHEAYNGEDYEVTIEPSRMRFRKMHQAINTVMRTLGRDILFPAKVVEKNPQIAFRYDKYIDELKTIKKEYSPAENNMKGEDEQKRESINNSLVVNNEKCDELKTGQKNESLVENKENVENNKLENEESINNLPKASAKKVTPTKLELLKKLTVLQEQNKPKLVWFDNSLNFFQKEAVRNILIAKARPLPYIIFGPPGTGKTKTMVEAILQVYKMIPSSRLLVCAPSNSAANILARRLIGSGILKPGDIVRLVAFRCVLEDSIPVDLVPYSAVQTIHQYERLPDDEVVLESGMKLGYTSKSIGRHRITVSTCSVAASLSIMGFPEGHFTHFFIDEAGQAVEPEIMLPLSIVDASSAQLVLAGDPMQLDPVVQSCAQKYGLNESYLERLASRFPYSRDINGFPETNGYDPRLITRLVYNYRALPELLITPNKLFYNSELIATISETDSAEAELLLKLKDVLPEREGKRPSSILFHGIEGTNYQTETNPSWFNPDEVAQVFYYLNQFYNMGLKAKDIGIITPYMQQVKHIKDLLISGSLEVPKVGSVEDFQGEERKVIILSTVRSMGTFVNNDLKFNIGFIGYAKRINVALTRAQVLNVIIGNPNVLSTDPNWRTIIRYCIMNNNYRGCECDTTHAS